MEAIKPHKITMTHVRKDALTDVVQNLPAAAQRPADKPAGTVVAANGERITLGEQGRTTKVITPPKQGMNLTEK